jgi:predicted enzyme related to lactoylglutathione lyase
MIKEIAFTAYPSQDVAALRAWYETNLGLTFGEPYKEEDVEQYNEAKVGSGYFSIMNHIWLQQPAGSGSGIAFEVDDLDQRLAELKAKGVEADEPYITPVCKLSTIRDAEGNKVLLHQITVQH